jgi:hypothetical protein
MSRKKKDLKQNTQKNQFLKIPEMTNDYGRVSAPSGIEVEPNGPIVENALAKSSQSIKELFKSTEKYFQRRICNGWRNRFKEINFKTMESKLHENLYFVEIVNIDAITGGFNFQNAWTSGYIVAILYKSINKVYKSTKFYLRRF